MATAYPYPVPQPPATDTNLIVGFPSSTLSITDILDRIREENDLRSEKAEVWAFWMYFIAVLGLIAYTMIPTLLGVYVIPRLHSEWKKRRSEESNDAQPKSHPDGEHETIGSEPVDLRFWMLYIGIPLFAIQFIVSGAGGLPGWMVINFLYFCLIIGLWLMIWLLREDDNAETEGKSRAIYKPPHWRCVPEEMSRHQKIHVIGCATLVITCFIVLIIIAYAYSTDTYIILDRSNNTPMREHQPQAAAKTLQLMYAYPHFATNMRLAIYAKLFTEYCGETFSRPLDPEEKDTVILRDWIEEYGINMTDYTPSDYTKYETVNEWFTRRIKPAMRPIPRDLDVIVSPADSRLTVFQNLNDVDLWIKTDSFSVKKMLGGDDVRASGLFEGGSLLIFRLAPQDYHRFHTPVTGTIAELVSLDNTYWSVSSDAARSKNDAFYNTRKVMILDTARFGKVAMVSIGATCVGSVKMAYMTNQTLSVGEQVTRGEEVGSMGFGGSTVVLVFQAGKIVIDSDLTRNSRFEVETKVLVNERVAQHPSSAIATEKKNSKQ